MPYGRPRRHAGPRPGRARPATPSKSPSREAARNASTTSRCRARSASGAASAPWTRRRARLASCRAASGRAAHDRRDLLERHGEQVVQHEREPLGRRERVQHDQQRQPDRVGQHRLVLRAGASGGRGRLGISTERLLAPRLAARAACPGRSGRRPWSASRRGCRPRSVSARLSRSQASWTASSASLGEPSIRYATARRCGRCASNRCASPVSSATTPSSRRPRCSDGSRPANMTGRTEV